MKHDRVQSDGRLHSQYLDSAVFERGSGVGIDNRRATPLFRKLAGDGMGLHLDRGSSSHAGRPHFPIDQPTDGIAVHQTDQSLRIDFSEPDLLPLRIPVTRRSDIQQIGVPELFRPDTDMRLGIEGNGNVEILRHKALDELRRMLGANFVGNFGMRLLEALYGVRHDAHAEARNAADPDAPLSMGRKILSEPAQVPQLVEDLGDFRRHHLGLAGGDQPSLDALEKPEPELLLGMLDQLADGRLADAQKPCGTGDCACLEDGMAGFYVTQLKHGGSRSAHNFCLYIYETKEIAQAVASGHSPVIGQGIFTMKICILGAGVVGLTTAYFLARSGHEISIVDRNGLPAQETSFANGGQLSYSYVAPLAAPSIFPSLPKYLLDRQSPLGFQLRADPSQWRWLLNFLRACSPGTFQKHTAELAMLADFSRTAMHDLMQAESLDFDFNRFGKLVIHRDRKSFENAVALAAYQKELGAEQDVLDDEACIALEPSLASLKGQFSGGVFTPSEEAGDCRKFCEALDKVLGEQYGVTRLYHHKIGALRADQGRVRAVSTDRGDVEADHFVMTAGLTSRELMRPLGVSLPLCALKGYSLTVAVPEATETAAPKISVTDSQNKIVYARLGDSLRIAAMVDIGTSDAAVNPRRLDTLKRQVRSTFPKLADLDNAQSWAGLRPATAQGKPIIGKTPYRNLSLNVGHGALGFTLACGSARLIRDFIDEKPAALDATPFALGAVQ